MLIDLAGRQIGERLICGDRVLFAHLELPVLVIPSQGTFHNIALLAKAASVGRDLLGEERLNAQFFLSAAGADGLSTRDHHRVLWAFGAVGHVCPGSWGAFRSTGSLV